MIVQVFLFSTFVGIKSPVIHSSHFSPALPVIDLIVFFYGFEVLARTREEGAGLPCTRFYDL
jgi:hypothetical protein